MDATHGIMWKWNLWLYLNWLIQIQTSKRPLTPISDLF